MKTLKVSLSTGNHSTGRGIGVYAEHLIEALKKQKDIILTDKDPDIVHYPFFDLFYHTLPFKKDKPTFVTIHDLTPLVMSDRYPKGIRGTFNFFRQWHSLKNITGIVTDSKCSQKDIVKILQVDPEKVFVTPLAADNDYRVKPTAKRLEEIRKKFNLPDKFILNLSAGPNPNKNLPSLAEVTDRLGIPLVIVGKDLTQEIKQPVPAELIDLVRLQVYNHLTLTGRVTNEEFNCLLHLAALYVQPSYYEGFGLPLLEAMTTGCLAVSSNTSSLPEVYYDNMITFNPKSLRSMEKAIVRALKLTPSRKQIHIALGKKKSQEFSWDKTAKLTVKAYRAALNQDK